MCVGSGYKRNTIARYLKMKTFQRHKLIICNQLQNDILKMGCTLFLKTSRNYIL